MTSIVRTQNKMAYDYVSRTRQKHETAPPSRACAALDRAAWGGIFEMLPRSSVSRDGILEPRLLPTVAQDGVLELAADLIAARDGILDPMPSSISPGSYLRFNSDTATVENETERTSKKIEAAR